MSTIMFGNSRLCDRDQMRQVPTPEATRTYTPLPFSFVDEKVMGSLDRHGLRPRSPVYALSKKNQVIHMVYEIDKQLPENVSEDQASDHTQVFVCKTSHDRSTSCWGMGGTDCTVCDNGWFFGGPQMRRVHRGSVDLTLGDAIDEVVIKLIPEFKKNEPRILAYKGTEISDPEVHDVVIRALDRKVISATQLPRVIGQWRHSPFEEYSDPTVWSLANAFTHVLTRGKSTGQIPRKNIAMNEMLDELCVQKFDELSESA